MAEYISIRFAFVALLKRMFVVGAEARAFTLHSTTLHKFLFPIHPSNGINVGCFTSRRSRIKSKWKMEMQLEFMFREEWNLLPFSIVFWVQKRAVLLNLAKSSVGLILSVHRTLLVGHMSPLVEPSPVSCKIDYIKNQLNHLWLFLFERKNE